MSEKALMVRIAERVWNRWRDLQGDSEPCIVLKFVCTAAEDDAEQAVVDATRAAVEAIEADDDLTPGREEARAGECTVAATRSGVLVRIYDPDDLETLLQSIATRLEERGVSGKFDLLEQVALADLPDPVDFIECRVRVVGDRVDYEGDDWRPDPEALMNVAAVMARWCANGGQDGTLSLQASTLPRVGLTALDDVEREMKAAVLRCSSPEVADLTYVTEEGFRTVAIDPDGRVTAVQGISATRPEGWGPPVDALRELMKATAEMAVYGFVKRGSSLRAARYGRSVYDDWPTRPGLSDVNIVEDAACEDHYAPDAFAIQLLGPGYARRVPEGAEWRRTELGSGRVLVEHIDPGAWFDELFGPFGGKWPLPRPPFVAPDVLVRARRDFGRALVHADD